MVPYFRIFGFTVQAYGLLFLIAIWTGLEVVLRQARRLGLEANHISNLVFYALGATVFWAHVWFTWSPTGLLTGARFSPPSADTHGRGGSTDLLESPAAAGWATLDALAPGLAMTLTLERLGAFLDGRDFGEPTT